MVHQTLKRDSYCAARCSEMGLEGFNRLPSVAGSIKPVTKLAAKDREPSVRRSRSKSKGGFWRMD